MEPNKETTATNTTATAELPAATSAVASATPAVANDTITAQETPTAGTRDVISADAPPPSYEQHRDTTTGAENTAPLEKTAWQAATAQPASQPGQAVAPAVQSINIINAGEEPCVVDCPFCHQQTTTRTEKESTSDTSMAAICCCLFGGIICAFLPYCMQMCHDTHHFCTKCGERIAVRSHDGGVEVVTPAPPRPVNVAPPQIQAPQAVALSEKQ
ncbi:Uncharacterized protein PECH_001610 [Penicillium ucsense]|uniref:LITAF domain-containing protein n=1 Tax=Penicillium ucsense TaxID=2839758 RepID=A0A8J8WFF3_9EURO|nr:Uncharacterized protein PECM_001421 [Penicillium ucsense]KAF7732635.1 Uncharacterized protein PECH_001610 [Penicillium ucsense]